jgi:SAM-dependent methyltransferase
MSFREPRESAAIVKTEPRAETIRLVHDGKGRAHGTVTLAQREFTGFAVQFARPRGLFGALAGWLMAHMPKRPHEAWLLQLLELRPDDAILEVGVGPGVTIAELAKRLVDGHIAGVDPSPVMLRQARRRNARAIAAGCVELCAAPASALSFADASFDKAASLNSIAFWGDVECALAELHRVLRPGGRMVHVTMPQWLKGDEAAIDRLAVAIAGAVERAGFHDVRRDSRATWPVRSVAVIATR